MKVSSRKFTYGAWGFVTVGSIPLVSGVLMYFLNVTRDPVFYLLFLGPLTLFIAGLAYAFWAVIYVIDDEGITLIRPHSRRCYRWIDLRSIREEEFRHRHRAIVADRGNQTVFVFTHWLRGYEDLIDEVRNHLRLASHARRKKGNRRAPEEPEG